MKNKSGHWDKPSIPYLVSVYNVKFYHFAVWSLFRSAVWQSYSLTNQGGGGSRITIDRFPNSCSPRKCLYFISLKSPSWAFSGSFRQGYWPDFNLGNLYSKSCRKIFIYEKLTDSRKTVEIDEDLRLLILSSFPIHCNRSLMARSELNRDKFNDRKISKTTVQDTLETANRARLCPKNYWVV